MLDDNFSTIGDAIRRTINAHPQRNKFSEAAIMHAWRSIMPIGVQEKTNNIYIKDNKLHVKIESSALRHTLQMNKLRILEELNSMKFDSAIIDLVLL